MNIIQSNLANQLDPYRSPVEGGRLLIGMSCICDDSFVLAAVCCCTRTSAASARCMSVLRSGLSSKFLHPTHLHMCEHRIFACKHTNYKLPNKIFPHHKHLGGANQNDVAIPESQPNLLGLDKVSIPRGLSRRTMIRHCLT